MKNFRYLFIFLAALTSNSCEIKDPSDDINLIIDYNVITTGVGITFVDAATNIPLQTKNGNLINVTLIGDQKSKILEPSGEYHDSYNVEVGLLNLVVNPNYTVSESNPVKFQVQVKYDGYLPTTRTIEITQEGLVSLSVPLVNLQSAPKGVSVGNFSNVGSTLNGVLQSDVSLSNDASGFDIFIPKNTKITDDSGTPLNGKLSVQQVVYSPSEESSLALMPGNMGLFADAVLEDGTSAEIGFYSAGFFNMVITDESGRKGTKFSNGDIDITYETDQNLINPETETQVKAGDIIPVWSFDETNQKWKYEMDGEFKLVDGKLVATASISHLSYWNFDWWYNSARCSTGATVKFVTNNTNDKSLAWFEGSYYDQKTGRFLSWNHFYGNLNTNLYIRNAPSDLPVKVVFSSGDYRYNLPSDLTINNLCSGTYTVNLTQKVTKSLTVSILAKCKKGSRTIEVRPSGWVYYYDLKNYYGRWAAVTQGKVTLDGLSNGEKYIIYAYYGGWQSTDFTYDGTENLDFNLDMPSSICNNF